MVEIIRNSPFSIEAFVNRHLEEEFNSGDPRRVRRASLAQRANERYGIGNWCWGDGPRLGGLWPMESAGGKIIPLIRD